MVLTRLLQVGTLTALGQALSFVAGLWLLRSDPQGLGVAYVALTSILAVTQATLGGVVASDLMWMSARERASDDEIRLLVRGNVVLSLTAGLLGAAYSYAGHSSALLGLAIVAGGLLNTSIEAVHYGSGRPGRGALLSLGKAAVVPVAFLACWAWGAAAPTAWLVSTAAFVAFAVCARVDVRRSLRPEVVHAPLSAAIARTGVAATRGIGPAANSLQRSAPLAVLTPFSSVETVHWLYVFYTVYNLLYGGFRTISQVAFREFGSPGFARRASRVLAAGWVAVVAALAMATLAAPQRPDWLVPLLAAVVATLPAAVFLASHVRMTLFGRFRSYAAANVAVLAGVVVVAFTTTHHVWQPLALVGVAALGELCAGIVYRRETLRVRGA